MTDSVPIATPIPAYAKPIQTAAFWSAVLSVIAAAVMCLVMVWGDYSFQNSATLRKGLSTALVVFVASVTLLQGRLRLIR